MLVFVIVFTGQNRILGFLLLCSDIVGCMTSDIVLHISMLQLAHLVLTALHCKMHMRVPAMHVVVPEPRHLPVPPLLQLRPHQPQRLHPLQHHAQTHMRVHLPSTALPLMGVCYSWPFIVKLYFSCISVIVSIMCAWKYWTNIYIYLSKWKFPLMCVLIL